jgi:hypothetical protein
MEQAASSRENRIGHLTRQNAESKRLLENAKSGLAALRPQAISNNIKKDTNRLRIEMRRWIADRDSFRRQLEVLTSVDHTTAAENRVDSMRERAYVVENYEFAIAILEENKHILQEVHGRRVAYRKRVEAIDPVVKLGPIDDSLLKQVDDDLIKIDLKFNRP